MISATLQAIARSVFALRATRIGGAAEAEAAARHLLGMDDASMKAEEDDDGKSWR